MASPLFYGSICCLFSILSWAALASDTHNNQPETGANTTTHAPPIIMAQLDGQQPWSYQTDNGEHGFLLGYTADLLNSIGQPYTNRFYSSYPRIIDELSKGRIAGTMVYTNDAYPLPSSPNIECGPAIASNLKWGVYAMTGHNIPPVSQISDLGPYRFSITKSTDDEMIPGLDYNKAYLHIKPENMVRMVIAGRTDFMITTRAQTAYWQKIYGVQFAELLLLSNYSIHMCFSKDSLSTHQLTQIIETIKATPKIPPFELGSKR